MKNKNILKTLIFIFIIGCGYNPILVDKKYPFTIQNIEKIGNAKVNSTIFQKLKNLKKNEDYISNKVIYNIKLNSETEKKIISKDSKGDPLIFEIKVTTVVTISRDGYEKILSQTISNKINYDNQTDKFELIKYENSLITNLSTNIADKILSILSNI